MIPQQGINLPLDFLLVAIQKFYCSRNKNSSDSTQPLFLIQVNYKTLKKGRTLSTRQWLVRSPKNRLATASIWRFSQELLWGIQPDTCTITARPSSINLCSIRWENWEKLEKANVKTYEWLFESYYSEDRENPTSATNFPKKSTHARGTVRSYTHRQETKKKDTSFNSLPLASRKFFRITTKHPFLPPTHTQQAWKEKGSMVKACPPLGCSHNPPAYVGRWVSQSTLPVPHTTSKPS